ncbi:MAG TPA: hypothetical protein VGL58_11125 [Caulobacteraceae bacterium]|jgi:hypothetical protein
MTDTIHRVVIKCPTTGQVVSTVMRLRPAAFEALAGSHAFRCDRCGQIHHWRREDAWLEDAAKRVGAG